MAGHKYKSMFKQDKTKPHQISLAVLPSTRSQDDCQILQDDKKAGNSVICIHPFGINNLIAANFKLSSILRQMLTNSENVLKKYYTVEKRRRNGLDAFTHSHN